MKSLFRRQRGMALIVVLACLVLVSVLVISFLNSVTTELKSSKLHADSTNVRLLADTAVNLVMGQIKEGTSGRNSANARVAWASQPGMIRTYDELGNASAYYKLYSSGTMVESGAFALTSDSIPPSWSQDTGLFTDLNEPALDKYPIVDPGAKTLDNVQGFDIVNAPVGSGSGANPAPMPVKWLYILRNGKLIAPSGTGSLATLGGTDGPSPNNPIVGRIAFWTDDESCKININTAIGDEWNASSSIPGTFWDVPIGDNSTERGGTYALAINQPGQKEYTRYPGHPATTYLSAVFPNLTRAQIYDIAPRFQGGGSMGGTVPTASSGTSSGSLLTLSPDKDRLYASVDELVFDPVRNSRPSLNKETVGRLPFFLSANSRAPEVNLFNRPRISMWPITQNSFTAFDQLIKFASTIGGRAYYFERTARTGAHSATNDYASIQRNRQLFSYLQELTSKNPPGFTGNFQSKYGDNRDQILTEIFDYIRSTNLLESSDGSVSKAYTDPPVSIAGDLQPGSGAVVPIEINGKRGFGRWPTICEPGVVFYVKETKIDGANTTDKIEAVLLFSTFNPALGYVGSYANYNISLLRAFNIPCVFGAAPNTTAFTYNFSPGSTTVDYWGGLSGLFRSRGHGEMEGIAHTLVGKSGAKRVEAGGAYPFVSTNFFTRTYPTGSNPPPMEAAAFAFDVDIAAYGTTVQSFHFSFPAFRVDLCPMPPTGSAATNSEDPATHNNRKFVDFSERVKNLKPISGSTQAWSAIIQPTDVARSLQVVSGDVRLIAGRRDVPASMFRPHPDYAGTSRLAHGIRPGHAYTYYMGDYTNGGFGRLVKNVSYASSPPTKNGDVLRAIPYLPKDMNGVFMTGIPGSPAGDWDTGIALVCDGAYINKPDEGQIKWGSGSNDQPYYAQANAVPGVTMFSPNRQVPSAVMFGSLPSRLQDNVPWCTLLFAPNPAAGNAHPAKTASPPDHLLLDLFNMPVVEPYAISEPLSTAGKINMNYQIVPFSYLKRDTGLRAVLRSTRVTAIPTSRSTSYKQGGGSDNYRYAIDAAKTLEQFEDKFSNNEIFRTASEICDIFLIPQAGTGNPAAGSFDKNSIQSFWNDHALTGDNLRERPYASLYPRLTTQSNVFTVHYRVQTLQKPTNRQTGAAATEFDPAKGDLITGEFRGSTTIERYVDPNYRSSTGDLLPDFATANFTNPDNDLSRFYRFRILGTKTFAP